MNDITVKWSHIAVYICLPNSTLHQAYSPLMESGWVILIFYGCVALLLH